MNRHRGSHGKCTEAECQGPLRMAGTGVNSLCLEVLQNREQNGENTWRSRRAPRRKNRLATGMAREAFPEETGQGKEVKRVFSLW